MRTRAFVLMMLASLCGAQQACEGHQDCQSPEQPLLFNIQKCTKSGGCQKDGTTYVTMDANWRWTQIPGQWTNCWDQYQLWVGPDCQSSSDQLKCAQNCMLEGVDYSKYGVSVGDSGNSVKLLFKGPTGNIGSRLYVVEQSNTENNVSVADSWRYKAFQLKNKEISFTVDGSTLGCGINGPIYFVEMPLDGDYDGQGNTAGPQYGTGYCDAQCPGDLHFVKGKANIPIQEASPPYSTDSAYHNCCNEIDLWEANIVSQALTPHPCAYTANGSEIHGSFACTEGKAKCMANCDHAGCDMASYRLEYYDNGRMNASNVKFYGEGMTVDASKPITVVTQFITHDGTDTGDLTEIRRVYVQDGKVINNFQSQIANKTYDSITDEFCTDAAATFDGEQHFGPKGGLKAMGDSLDRGMTLVLSLWDDHEAHMLWLDGLKYPLNASTSDPGVVRGTCDENTGPPMQDENMFANDYVEYSNIKYGEIGSTYP